jgi:hypothetical protein
MINIHREGLVFAWNGNHTVTVREFGDPECDWFWVLASDTTPFSTPVTLADVEAEIDRYLSSDFTITMEEV